MLLRQEQEAEFPLIYDLVKTAFETARVSNGEEQNFVARLRAGGNYIPELALVAEEEGKLIGHIMLTRTFVETAAGRQPLLLLGPLAVALERRRQGLGSRLVQQALRLAQARGHTAVVLVGDPAYYSRFGFQPANHFEISNTNGIPDGNVLLYELVPGALGDLQGTISFQV
jgi:predicted N-acetyltransferase YhbS